MSWDILPKSNLQYFLTKLKGIFDKKVDKETGKGLFSGSYNDLTNKPTIPAAANNNTITIQLNGVTVESFTLNQATDETINIQVTKSSVGLGNVGNFKAVSTEASQGLTDTEKSNARANIGAGTSSTDQQVYQENTNANTDYRVLLGVENDITSYVYKSIGLRYNPGKDSVYTEKINDTILGNAIGFDVQNSGSASDLTNGLLPTGQTIKSYLNSNLTDFIKPKRVWIDNSDLSQQFNLIDYVNLDPGYKFLCWLPTGASDGWVSNFPIYVANTASTYGFVFWNGDLPIAANKRVVFTYLEVKM